VEKEKKRGKTMPARTGRENDGAELLFTLEGGKSQQGKKRIEDGA